MTMDIKDFYLNTPMTRYEYMQLKISDMPDDVIEHYNLLAIATPDGFIYCEIQGECTVSLRREKSRRNF